MSIYEKVRNDFNIPWTPSTRYMVMVYINTFYN